MEILGGEFEMSARGTYSSIYNNRPVNYTYGWKYFISDNPYLKLIKLGNISTVGSSGRNGFNTNIEGLQLTNEPIINPVNFQDYDVLGTSEPGNDVELYLDNKLVDHTRVDSTGQYSFSFPLRYGRTRYSVKSYNKKGIISDDNYMLNIPVSILKPGEIRYTLSGGRIPESKKYVIGGIFSTGLTSWMTNSVTIEKHQGYRQYYIIDKLSLNLFNNLNTDLMYFHNEDITTNLSYSFDRYLDLNFAYLKNINKNTNQPGRIKESYTLGLGLPNIFSLPVNLFVAGRRQSQKDVINNQLDARVYATIGPINTQAYYSYNLSESPDIKNIIKQTLQVNLMYSLPSAFRPIMLDMTRLNFTTNYNITSGIISSIVAGLSKNLFGFTDLNLFYSYRPASKTYNFNAGLSMNFMPFRSDSKATLSGEAYSYYEGIRGAIGFDPDDSKFYFQNNRQMRGAGYGSAVIRYFVDSNLDNKCDENEMLLPDVKVRIPQARVRRDNNSPDNIAFNVPSYGRMNVSVDKDSFKNPLWTPTISEFSFISNPNGFKHIDIPCYASGVIEGAVYKNDGKSKKAQPGIKVVVISNDSSNFKQSITCFSDGNFYYMGVPPGNYKAEIDSVQLAKLNLVAEPAFIEFTVKRTTDGDFINDLVFELSQKNAIKSQTNTKEK
jgi:hypothetical protein